MPEPKDAARAPSNPDGGARLATANKKQETRNYFWSATWQKH